MTKEQIKEIEQTARFKFFLLAFGLRNVKEYEELSQKEKQICIDEYLKTQREEKTIY